MEKTIKKVEKDINSLSRTVKEPLQSVIVFVRKHRRLLVVVALLYIAYSYMFNEEE